MKNLLKILQKHCAAFLTLCLVVITTSACTKDGNPWNLPDVNPADYVGDANDGVIKILAIGNSFSENAIESHLYELAKESGKTVIIGNMYIGGASLAQHKDNAEGQKYAYQYRKISVNGEKKTYKPTSIDRALEDEPWDYISFQQASPNSGQLATVQASLPAVYNYVKSKASNPNVKYIYHQTWAYSPNTNHSGFVNYGKSQAAMYDSIMNVSQKVKDIVKIDMVVPAGTAIQNARSSALGDSYTAGDGYHLNELGKYVAACTWFEKLFGQSVVGMKYKPEGMSAFEVKVAQNAAHLAVQQPFKVTSMADYQAEPIPLESPVLIDFGNSSTAPSWNPVTSVTEGTKVNLKDSLNVFVGMSLTITERFNNINTNGATSTNTSLNMPENVSKDNFFGNAKAWGTSIITPRGSFVLSGLVPGLSYNFCFFGSRSATNNRETTYTVTGSNQGSGSLNAGSNSMETACISNIKPDAEGKITISVTAGANNVTNEGFFYLNAAKITSNNN